jgi:hypothetical protein
LPGPEKVAAMIYHAATDTSSRLRYPVIAFPMITIRKLFGARIWTALSLPPENVSLSELL